jgi:hypothetical protein
MYTPYHKPLKKSALYLLSSKRPFFQYITTETYLREQKNSHSVQRKRNKRFMGIPLKTALFILLLKKTPINRRRNTYHERNNQMV